MDSWLKWIKANEKDKAIWAVNQLLKRGFITAHDLFDDPFETLNRAIKRWPEEGNGSDKYKLLEIRMRRAWQQHKLRKGLMSRKAYSFTMSKEAKRAIDALARTTNKPISRALEELILQEHDLLKALKEKHKQEKESLRLKLSSKGADQQASVSPVPAAPKELDSQAAMPGQWEVIQKLLRDALLEGVDTSAAQIRIQEAVDARLKSRLEELEREVASMIASPDFGPTTSPAPQKKITLTPKSVSTIHKPSGNKPGDLDRE